MTVFVHEVHRVVGTREDEFESIYRDEDGWMDVLGREAEARLLSFFHLAHGSGPSYHVVTMIGLADGTAWERLSRRLHGGDLADLARRTDELRHDVTARLMMPAPWSPVTEVDLAAVPSTPGSRPPALYMEDTMWPHPGRLGDYLAVAAERYVPMLARPDSLLRLDAALVTVTGTRPEVMLMQAARDPDRIGALLAAELKPEHRPPGTWMHDALEFRDQWRSRLLRPAPWSPWP